MNKIFAFFAALMMVGTQAGAVENWDLANEYPATSLTGRTADRFAELVAEKTEGEVRITVHHGGALGYKSVDHFDAVSDGALQIALSPFSFWSGIDPIFQLSTLPFVTPSREDALRLLKIARPEYAAVLHDSNQILLVAAPYVSTGMWGNKSFTSLEDLKGVKVRTYDAASTETMRQASALPLQVAWSDLPAQLSTNAIEAVMTSANGGIGIQMWELQSHFTAVNYGTALYAIHVNRDVFEALDSEVQQQVLDAAAEAEAFGWQHVANLMTEDFVILRENGVTVVEEVPEVFTEQLKAAGQIFIDAWAAEVGARATDILGAYAAGK